MVLHVTKSFRLAGKGLGRALGDLEKAIMEALWDRGDVTGKEVFEELHKTRDVALTTVLTVLKRLVKKGLVVKEKGGSTYLYSPVCSRDEFADAVAQEVLKGVFELSTSSATASFVDILADKDVQELDRLSLLIEKKKEELSGDNNTKG